MRKLQRKKGSRGALLKNLVKSVILHEKITTTLPKAKEIRPKVERLIERGKKQDLAARRYLLKFLPKKATAKVIEVLSPRFLSQKGGYVQVLKIGQRASDGAFLAMIKFKETKQTNDKKTTPKSQ